MGGPNGGPGGIFIAYRREDSADMAGRIFDRLVDRYGRQRVMKDLDAPLGVPFQPYVAGILRQCVAQVVIIGPHWLGAGDERGERRLDNPSDPVRLEVEEALRQGVPVIPVLVEEAGELDERALPPSIGELARGNPVRVRNDPAFEEDVARLLAAVERWAPLGPPPSARAWTAYAPVYGAGTLAAGAGYPAVARGPKRGRRGLAICGAVLACVVVACAGLQILGRAGLHSPFAVDFSDHRFPSGALTSMYCDATAGECWAVGNGGELARYAAGRWADAASPTTRDLRGISGTSRSDVWAVGAGGTLLHYDGSTWQQARSPTGADLTAVSMDAADDGWAAGRGGVLVHYDGTRWMPVVSPTSLDLSSITMASPAEGWAAGTGDLLHFTGGIWRPTATPVDGVGTHFASVAAAPGAHDAWAVGSWKGGGFLLHFSGGQWTQVTTPATRPTATVTAVDFEGTTTTYATNSVVLTRVEMDAPGDGWVLGYGSGTDTFSPLHYDGRAWSETAPLPRNTSLNDIATLSPSEAWGIGFAVVRYADGTWSQYGG